MEDQGGENKNRNDKFDFYEFIHFIDRSYVWCSIIEH